MDVREKLVELLAVHCDMKDKRCIGCEKGLQEAIECKNGRFGKFADHLIAHGVTVQELDGCEYRKEVSEGYRKMLGAFSITNPFHGNVWNIETCHCKPRQIYFCPMCGRKLPQPPKGE